MTIEEEERVPLAVVVLAAGKGTRMKSAVAKVLHVAAGRALIEYPVGLALALGAERTICVLGHQADDVQKLLSTRVPTVEVVLQQEQRGTGHAVAQTAPLLAGFAGRVLILYGDTPALTLDMLRRLVDASHGRDLALVTSELPDATGYGRILRDERGDVSRVVEERDCNLGQRRITEWNPGIYCARAGFLFPALEKLTPDNAQGELYLTDIVAQAAAGGEVATIPAPPEEVAGVNDRIDLERADTVLRRRVATGLMLGGVTLRQPETSRIDAGVTVGIDSEIGPLCQLLGATRIGANVRIDVGCVLTDTVVGDGAHLKPYTVVAQSEIGPRVNVGPFAHLRPGTVLGADVKIGNFVETKKARFGAGAKASHLSYLGDADIGKDVNVGCGTITCNYDGFHKYRTVIEDGVFIGSDTQLVAPVTVGAGAVIGAGTTVVQDVPAGALCVSRVPQVHKPGYTEKKRLQREAAASKKSEQ